MNKYTLVAIRDIDGCQEYRCPDAPHHLQTIFLSGIDRAHGVKVSDTGQMEYVSDRSRGYFTFIKD